MRLSLVPGPARGSQVDDWVDTDGMTGMNATSYSKLAATIFAIIALLQLARALTGWPIMFNGMAVPIWPSWIACGVAIVLAWLGFGASRA